MVLAVMQNGGRNDDDEEEELSRNLRQSENEEMKKASKHSVEEYMAYVLMFHRGNLLIFSTTTLSFSLRHTHTL